MGLEVLPLPAGVFELGGRDMTTRQRVSPSGKERLSQVKMVNVSLVFFPPALGREDTGRCVEDERQEAKSRVVHRVRDREEG